MFSKFYTDVLIKVCMHITITYVRIMVEHQLFDPQSLKNRSDTKKVWTRKDLTT